MKVEAVVGADGELGRQVGIPMPCTVLRACTKLVAALQEGR